MLRPLRRGATIGVSSPAGPVNPEKLERAIGNIRALGYQVKLTENVAGKSGFLSAPDEIRRQELELLFCDEEVDTIWCARGGVGSSRLLPTVDLTTIANSSKPFLGFSDLTALQWALWSKFRVVTFTGPLAVEFDGLLAKETQSFAFELLSGAVPSNWLASFPSARPEVLRSGAREIIATLLPGNLTMITTLLGTQWMPDLRGTMLVIEDIAEPLYRVDRLLFHLRNAGVLQNLAALIVGDFGWSGDDRQSNYELLKQSLIDCTRGTCYPIIMNFPYGHGPVRMTLPVGSPVRLSIAGGRFEISYAISPFDADS